LAEAKKLQWQKKTEPKAKAESAGKLKLLKKQNDENN